MRSKIITALLLSISIAAFSSFGIAQDKDKNKGNNRKISKRNVAMK